MNQLQLPCHLLSHQDSLPGCRDLLRFLQCINIMINKHVQIGHILSRLSSERNHNLTSEHNTPLQLHLLWFGKAATFIKMQRLSMLLLVRNILFMVSQQVIFYVNLTNYNLYMLHSYIQYKHTHPLTFTFLHS